MLGPSVARRMASIASCSVAKRGDAAVLRTSVGTTLELCCEWLIDNDVRHRHSTGQKLGGILNMAKYWDTIPALTSVVLDPAAALLRCTFADGHECAVRTYDVERYGLGRQGFKPTTAIRSAEEVSRIPFDTFRGEKKAALYSALERIWCDGLVVVEGCPTGCNAVLDIARAVDHELRTLYGTDFKVASKAVAGQPTNNIAYTHEFLDLHQDIVYLEAMPGVQLLLCERFDDDVVGGGSMFMDVFLVAEELRKRDPSAFEVLTQVPAAFMKDDMGRENPAQYYYAAPLIQCNDVGDIIKVMWAPAFEAPMPPTARMRDFYAAKLSFARVLEDLRPSNLIEFRMRPGECAVFHNCRMLHGRRNFTESEPGKRLLHGCYIEGDALRNRAVALARELGVDHPRIAFGNRSWR